MPDCLLKIVCAHFSIHCHKETDAVVMSWGDFRFTLVVWSMKILTSQGCRPECQLSWQGPQTACNYDVNHSMGPTHTPRQVTSMRHAFSRAERKHNRNDRRDVTSISSYSRQYWILACVCVYKYLANHHRVLQLNRWKLTQSVAENSWFYHFAHCKNYSITVSLFNIMYHCDSDSMHRHTIKRFIKTWLFTQQLTSHAKCILGKVHRPAHPSPQPMMIRRLNWYSSELLKWLSPFKKNKIADIRVVYSAFLFVEYTEYITW